MIVLMYHDIISASNSISGFQNDSSFQYKVNNLFFEECVKTCSPDKVLFSFDDGGVSFLEIAAPILEKYGHKGLFFIATDYINTPGFLTSDQVKELEMRGHTIGSHSCSHPHNMSLLTEEDIEKEWVCSLSILKNLLGHDVEVASIPNGYSSSVIVKKASLAGVKFLYTSTPTDKIKNIGNIKLIGRYVVHNDMTPEQINKIVDSPLLRWKKYMKWCVLGVVKFILGNRYDKIKSMILSKK